MSQQLFVVALLPRKACSIVDLVGVIDDLLADPGPIGTRPQLLLNGQVKPIDDYLEARPGSELGIAALVSSELLRVGPWYSDPIEFEVSGETLWRNLQLGLDRAGQLGQTLDVGYLPGDQGHVAQMPQILRAAGIDHAVITTPFGAWTDGPGFWWRSPDGSTVRCERLANAGDREPGARSRYLLDHLVSARAMPDVVGDHDLDSATPGLIAHLRAAPTEALASWGRELPANGRPISDATLPGEVLRNFSAVEQLLAQIAEPLATLWIENNPSVARRLADSWWRLIRARSLRSLADGDMLELTTAELRRAERTGHQVVRLAEMAAGQAFSNGQTVTLNPTSRDMSGLVETIDTTDVAAPGLQVLESERLPCGSGRPARSSHRVLAHRAHVPGFGWLAQTREEQSEVTDVRAGDDWLDNRSTSVVVNRRDGSFSIDGLAGLDGLVLDWFAQPVGTNSAGLGVEATAPESVGVRRIESGPLRARLEVTRHFRTGSRRWGSAGRVARRIADRGPGEGEVIARTVLELRAGEEMVRVAIHLESRGARPQVWTVFPLPNAVTETVADCVFATVRRNAPSSGCSPRHPSGRFIVAGDLVFTHEGPLRHCLVSKGGSLAVALTGWSAPAAPDDSAVIRQRYALATGVHNPYRLAELAWVPLRVVTGTGSSASRPATGSLLEVSGAEVSCLRRNSETTELRVFNPRKQATVVRIAGRAGRLVDLRDGFVERFDETFALRPWGIATVHLDG